MSWESVKVASPTKLVIGEGQPPETTTLDGYAASHRGVREMKAYNSQTFRLSRPFLPFRRVRRCHFRGKIGTLQFDATSLANRPETGILLARNVCIGRRLFSLEACTISLPHARSVSITG